MRRKMLLKFPSLLLDGCHISVWIADSFDCIETVNYLPWKASWNLSRKTVCVFFSVYNVMRLWDIVSLWCWKFISSLMEGINAIEMKLLKNAFFFFNRLCPSSTIHIFGSESFQKMLLAFDLFVHGMEFIT